MWHTAHSGVNARDRLVIVCVAFRRDRA